MSKPIKANLIKLPLLVIVLIWTLFPIYWMLSLAIRSKGELSGKLGLIPTSFSLESFLNIMQKNDFGKAITNSLIVTAIALTISLIIGLACAYILARVRYHFSFRKPLLLWVLLVRMLPPIAFALPLYIMFNQFGLLGTKIPLLFAHILICLPFIIWFMLSFFENLSTSIEESAKIDGASEVQLYTRIVLPLVLPGITAVAILSFMTSWNEYLYGAIFVQSPKQFTIPLLLSTLNSEQELAQWGTIAAGGIISMIPIFIFVILAQNFLIQGLSSGSIKE